MYNVYANLLGKWCLLDNKLDNISGSLPSEFVENIEDYEHQVFVRVRNNNVDHYLHISHIQWTD